MILVNIRHIEGDQLGDTQAAGEKQHQDTIIPQRIGTVAGGQEPFTLGFLQITRQRSLTLGHVKFLTNIIIQQMALGGQIIEKGFHRGSPAAAAGGRERVLTFGRKRLVAIELFDFDRLDEVQVDVRNVDLAEWHCGWNQMPTTLQKAKQDLEIMIITGDGQIGMAADRGVVFQKFHDDIGDIGDLIQIHCCPSFVRNRAFEMSFNLYYTTLCLKIIVNRVFGFVTEYFVPCSIRTKEPAASCSRLGVFRFSVPFCISDSCVRIRLLRGCS